jgi:hypothetical protein
MNYLILHTNQLKKLFHGKGSSMTNLRLNYGKIYLLK